MGDIEPEFNHDCEACTFLGTITRREMIMVTDAVVDALTNHIEKPNLQDLHDVLGVKPAEIWDLYFCGKGPLGGSIIARFGHEGPDYKSAPISLAEADTELKIGFDLAHKSALIPNCGVTEDDE